MKRFIIISCTLLITVILENYFIRFNESFLAQKSQGLSVALMLHFLNAYVYFILIKRNFFSYLGLGLVPGFIGVLVVVFYPIKSNQIDWFDFIFILQINATITLILLGFLYVRFYERMISQAGDEKNLTDLSGKNFWRNTIIFFIACFLLYRIGGSLKLGAIVSIIEPLSFLLISGVFFYSFASPPYCKLRKALMNSMGLIVYLIVFSVGFVLDNFLTFRVDSESFFVTDTLFFSFIICAGFAFSKYEKGKKKI